MVGVLLVFCQKKKIRTLPPKKRHAHLQEAQPFRLEDIEQSSPQLPTRSSAGTNWTPLGLVLLTVIDSRTYWLTDSLATSREKERERAKPRQKALPKTQSQVWILSFPAECLWKKGHPGILVEVVLYTHGAIRRACKKGIQTPRSHVEVQMIKSFRAWARLSAK